MYSVIAVIACNCLVVHVLVCLTVSSIYQPCRNCKLIRKFYNTISILLVLYTKNTPYYRGIKLADALGYGYDIA